MRRIRSFQFRVDLKNLQTTRREILSTISFVFDPLVLVGKRKEEGAGTKKCQLSIATIGEELERSAPASPP